MQNRLSELNFKVFRFQPRWQDSLPFIVWLFVSAVLQLSRFAGNDAIAILQWMKPLADLTFLISPLLLLKFSKDIDLAFLGITTKHWISALVIGGLIGLLAGYLTLTNALKLQQIPYLPKLFQSIAYFFSMLFHLLAIEIFYRGYLAAQMERSYGFFGALIGSGLLYAFSPLVLWGTDPNLPVAFSSMAFFWSTVFPFSLLMGILLAGIARLTRNLLAPIIIMLPQTIIGDLLPGGEAHLIDNPGAKIIETLALAGIVAVAFWMLRLVREKRGVSSFK